MPSDAEQTEVAIVFTPEFKRNLRQLARKYRHIKSDVQPLLDELAQGYTPGVRIPGVQYTVFKVRIRNSDSRKGRSGGYRIIYQQMHKRLIVLVTIYSKTEQTDITPNEIRQIILASEQSANVDVTQEQKTRDESKSDADL